jgi:caspase domain-containing protein
MHMNVVVRYFALGFMFAVGLFAEAHAAEQRVALVIGNGAYRSVPELRNSRNDADDVSEQLRRLGFTVIDGRDLDRSGMQAALGRFAQRLKGADAGLVYYSGHGLQVNGQNFLVPVDLKMDDGAFTPFEMVKVDDVVEALSYTDGVRLLVLDACRDNPFATSLAQNKGSRGAGVTRGLAKIERSQGMLIAYSTQPNAVAADGNGRNSPFTAALVREMQVPGVEVATVFRRVAVNVNRETAGAQTPELSVSLLQDFYLNPQESDISAWQKLGPSATIDGLKAFISRFPTSVMVDAARARLEAIENANARERLVSEYAEKERRLRQDLETAEAGYRKAAAELASRRERDERERLATANTSTPVVAPAPPAAPAGTGNAAEIAARTRDDKEREQQMKEQAATAERERLASQVAAFEADKARLSDERQALERAMTESLARAQAERERAEKRVATETARLPVVALDQQRTLVPATVPAPAPRRAASTCQQINARAQLGDISAADREILVHGCR